jgi:Na+-driven multidrug efflux pump
MDNKDKRVRRMAIWTITVFATVFSVIMAALWLFFWPSTGDRLQAVSLSLNSGAPIYLVVGFLCIATYFGYQFFANRKK